MPDQTPSFGVKPGDPADVSSALTSANESWKRGDRAGALRSLRLAVEAASEAELDERALELAKVAADLATHIGSMAPPRPSVAAAPRAPASPVAIPKVTPGAARPVVAKTPVREVPRTAPAKEAPRKADRKSMTNEASRDRQAERPSGRTLDGTDPDMAPPAPPAPRKRSLSRADRLESQRRSSRTDEIDEWPTEVLAGDELPGSLRKDGHSAKEAAPSKGATRLRASQAVRVLIWRDDAGLLQVTALGSSREAPSTAVEAAVVALDPGTDLVALLGERR